MINIKQLEEIYDTNHLVEAYYKAKQGTDWKESVQRYEVNLLLEVLAAQKAIKSRSYKPRPMTEFMLRERGHERFIKAQHVFDRVIQRSLNDNVLIPRVRRKLIYDNGASLTGKGLDFARHRFEIHLRKAYRLYGDSAYILLMDFSKYYDNVRHDKALEMYKPLLNDLEMEFLTKAFKEFEIDVSYMSPEEYSGCMDRVYNALEDARVPRELKTGTKYMRKSLGIGNQSAQITGVFFPHRIDNYCKIVKGVKFYGRYMDDTYIIMDSKEKLQELYKEIQKQCTELGIFINRKKTHIHKITSWVTWLKINYKVTPTGGLIRKIHSSTIRRERRKLKKYQRMFLTGKMSYPNIKQCYDSWRGSYKKFDSGATLHKLDLYFRSLFQEVKNYDGERTDSSKNH